jgi:four helix bundle protein
MGAGVTSVAFRFESLEIWHMACAYAGKVYALTSRFPRHEDYGLRSQMNRAANSISLNISEGSGKSSSKAFCDHLEIAVGSAFEVASAAFLARDQGYITENERRSLHDEGERLAKAISAFRSTLRSQQMAARL